MDRGIGGLSCDMQVCMTQHYHAANYSSRPCQQEPADSTANLPRRSWRLTRGAPVTPRDESGKSPRGRDKARHGTACGSSRRPSVRRLAPRLSALSLSLSPAKLLPSCCQAAAKLLGGWFAELPLVAHHTRPLQRTSTYQCRAT